MSRETNKGRKMNIKEYFKTVGKRLPEFKRGMYKTFKKMIYVAGVGVFVTIILCGVIWGVSHKARQQQQCRLESFPCLLSGARYCKEKQYKKAIGEFQEAIERNPGEDNADAYFGLAYALQKLGHYRKSIECYRRVVALNPDDARAYVKLGFALSKQQQQQGKTSEAKREALDKLFPNLYFKANNSNQDLARAGNHYDQGVAFYKEKQYRKAIKEFQEAIVNPARDNKGAYHGLGMAHRELKQYGKAIEYFWMTVILSPNNAQNYAELGVTYGLAKNYDLALKNLRCAIVLRPSSADVWLNLGVAHRSLKQFNKSIECYEKAIFLKPKYALAHFNLGGTYREIGNKQAALREHKTLMDLNATKLAAELKTYIETGVNPEEVS